MELQLRVSPATEHHQKIKRPDWILQTALTELKKFDAVFRAYFLRRKSHG